MSIELSAKLRQLTSDPKLLMFWCPGCGCAHVVAVRDGLHADHPAWGWNGDVERPTFTPSILIRNGHHAQDFKPGDPCWCTYNAEHPENPASFGCGICHSFVTDGRIQFLGDCTHALAGQTVDLQDIPVEEVGA